MNENKIVVYTDGAARGNPGRGGFGIILLYGDKRKELSAGYRLTTNNRMELLAVITALEALKQKKIPVEIYTDSQYVVNSIEKKWVDKWVKTNFSGGKKNKDLWIRFYTLAQDFSITIKWVKGHAANVHNNRCDILATNAADSSNLQIDDWYEKQESAL